MEISNILNASSIRFIDNFQVVERSLQHKLFLNLNPSRQTNFVILVLWTSKDRPFLISSQGANQLLMSVAIHCSTTKTSQMLPQHHYVVSFKCWIKTKNKACSCDHLHFIVSSCSKIPRAPIISQVFFSQNQSHFTFTLKTPKNLTKMMIATTTTLEIVRFFHHFPRSGP